MNAKRVLLVLLPFWLFFFVHNNLSSMAQNQLDSLQESLTVLKAKLGQLGAALMDLQQKQAKEKKEKIEAQNEQLRKVQAQNLIDFQKNFRKVNEPLEKFLEEIEKPASVQSFFAKIWKAAKSIFFGGKKETPFARVLAYKTLPLHDINQELSQLIPKVIATMPAHDKKELENYAEIKGYGYKTGNLGELKKICDSLQFLTNLIASKAGVDELKIRVPEFVGISSDSVKNFLKGRGFDVKGHWQKFIANFNAAAQAQFKKDQNFSKDFLAKLKVLENAVMTVFESAAQDQKALDDTFNFDANFEAGIEKKLTEIKRFKSSLMVRSTGKEDTDKLANAGGNETVPNVAPQKAEILLAMGVVVASYFSEKSFTQRLIGGDSALFDEPFTPALIQRMIGERIRGIRSKNVRSVLNQVGGTLLQKWNKFKTNLANKNSLDDFFMTQESDLDGMLSQALKNGWQIKVSLSDGTQEKTVAANADAVVNVLNAALANGKLPNDYSAFIIEPVQNQKIIERVVPVCGVMFTEEPGGGIAKKSLLRKEFGYSSQEWDYSQKAPSTGIVQIDMSYGHNEGVVNSLVGVDTYYLSAFDKIYPIVRPKPFRKFPSLKDNVKLEDRYNAPSLANSKVLKPYEGLMLKVLASALEEYYYKPMDVEFVIDRNASTIYLVQARPITHNPKQSKPSYLADPEKLKGDHFEGETIIPADGTVRLIAGKQIIIKRTMGEAFDAYMRSKNKDNIECVVVGQHAPPTSHEGTQFRTAVKPVIFMKNINQLVDKASKSGLKFLVDPQQGLVIADDSKQTLDQLKTSKVVLEGWKNYPISPLLSSCKFEDFDAALVDKNLNELQAKLIDGITESEIKNFVAVFKKTEQGKVASVAPSIEALLNAVVQESDEKKVRLNVSALLNIVLERMKNYAKTIVLDENLKTTIALFKDSLSKVCSDILETRTIKKESDDYVKRLLPVRFLQALLFQQPDFDQVLDAFSLANFVLRMLRPEARAIAELKKQGIVAPQGQDKGKIAQYEEAVQYAKIAAAGLNSEVQNKWVQFVAKVGNVGTIKQKEDFNEAVGTLGKLGLLNVWLHTDFFEQVKNQQNINANSVLQSLVISFNKDKILLQDVEQKIARVKALKPDLFAQFKMYPKQWALLTTLVTELTDQAFIQKYKNAEDLGKVAVLSLLELFVDTFDQSIKAIKASNEYEVITDASSPNLKQQKNKLFTFRTMLTEYLRLLELIKDYIGLSGWGLSDSLRILDSSVATKLINAKNSLDADAKLCDDKQLEPSANFNVALIVVGNKTGNYLKASNTYEDIFTFIHQSLINVSSFFLGQTKVKELENENSPALPTLVINVLKQIHSIKKHGSNHATLMGLSFGKGTLGYKYNYPLRSHSATLLLEYNKKTNTARFGCRTSGENEWGRFYKIGDYAEAVAWALNLKDVEVTSEKKAVTFWWTVTNEDIIRLNGDHKQLILAQSVCQANDGQNGQDGLSYATDGTSNVIDRENKAYNFIANNLLTSNDLKQQFAKKVIAKSLSEKSYPHMYLNRVLEYIPGGSSGDADWNHVLEIMKKLLSRTAYAVNADIFFFRCNRCFGFGDYISKVEYYGISEENIYSTLAAHENDGVAITMQSNRGINSFKQAIPQVLFNTIVTKKLYNKFSNVVWKNFLALIESYAEFFVTNSNLQTFLNGASNNLGKQAVQGVATRLFIFDDVLNLNKLSQNIKDLAGVHGFNAAAKKDFVDTHLEFVCSQQTGAAIFKNVYSLPQSVDQLVKNKLWQLFKQEFNRNQLMMKNVIELLDFCDNAKLENVFDQILAENKFSWIDVNNVGGMAYPDSFAYIKALESKGVKCLVSLTNEAVLPQEWFTQASAVPGWSSIRNEHISVRDFVVPTIAQIRKFVALANQPLIAHSAGGNEVIDIMLACWLVKEKKMTPAQAIEEMRLKRPGSVETKEQEKAIEAYKADLDKPSPWTYYLANAPAVVGPLAYTNQQALIQDISSYVFADTYVPGIDSEQRKKLQDVFDAVPVLLDSPDDVFALLKSHGEGRRIKLLLTHILLQSGYQDDEFLKNYAVQYTIVSNANIGPNYNYLAARNYNLLIKNIQNKIYTLLQAHMLNGARKGIGGNNQQYFTLGLTLGNNYPGVL